MGGGKNSPPVTCVIKKYPSRARVKSQRHGGGGAAGAAHAEIFPLTTEELASLTALARSLIISRITCDGMLLTLINPRHLMTSFYLRVHFQALDRSHQGTATSSSSVLPMPSLLSSRQDSGAVMHSGLLKKM